jgi:energy-coupling factor transport system ATP-binding protein
MINIKALSFKYPGSVQQVFDEIHCQIAAGTLTLIVGASGSGKSTLLRCINGLVPHFSGGTISGQIDVFGSDPIKEGPERLSSKIGFVFQEPEAQFVFDIVEDEIAFALENMGMPRNEMGRRVDDVIQQLGLTALRNKSINEISGGEKQKVAIASVLVTKPQVLLLDEPTSQLDPTSADQILKLCVDLKKQLNLTILISEHRLERLLPYTEKIMYLRNDHKLISGPPQEILFLLEAVPPVVKIAKKLNLSPIPLVPEEFPSISISEENLQKDSAPSKNIQDNFETSLELKGLSKNIDNQEILKNVSFDLRKGELFVLIGQNGAGKTSLLRAILGLTPSVGQRQLFGKNMAGLSLAKIIKHIAYLPQNPNDLLFAETVLNELDITLRNHGIQKNQVELLEFLNLFGMKSKAQSYPRDLSAGERQRTALAAITVHDPEIIFLDEPTRGLDYIAKENLSKVLKRWRDNGKSILLVTHDVEFAAGVADRLAILDSGEIIFNGSPKIGFSKFPGFQTQTARVFPGKGWVIPEDIPQIIIPAPKNS